MSQKNEPPVDASELADWARAQLRKGVPEAIRSMLELSSMADSETVRLQASKDVLGIIGVSQKQNIEIDHGIKASKEEVDYELQRTLERLDAGRAIAALPPGDSGEKEIVVVEKVHIEHPSEDSHIEDPPEESV